MSNVASRIIGLFGGAKALADALKCDVSRVHRWTYPKGRGGNDGEIPPKRIRQILDLARAKNIDLTADDFFADVVEKPKRSKQRAQ